MSDRYTPQAWANGVGGNTPVNAARLGHMEAGIEALDEALDTVIPNSAFGQDGDFLLGTGPGTYEVVSLFNIDGGTATSTFDRTIDGGGA